MHAAFPKEPLLLAYSSDTRPVSRFLSEPCFLAHSSDVIVSLHRFFFEDLQDKLVQSLALAPSMSRMSQMTLCFMMIMMIMTDRRMLIVEVVVMMIIVHEPLNDVIATQLGMAAGHIA